MLAQWAEKSAIVCLKGKIHFFKNFPTEWLQRGIRSEDEIFKKTILILMDPKKETWKIARKIYKFCSLRFVDVWDGK